MYKYVLYILVVCYRQTEGLSLIPRRKDIIFLWCLEEEGPNLRLGAVPLFNDGYLLGLRTSYDNPARLYTM